MSKVTILMLGHKSLAGKDTLAAQLCEKDDYIRYGFADMLKDTVMSLYDFSHEQMYGDMKNVPDQRYPNTIDGEGHFTPRRVLQIFGQQQRTIYPDIWAAYVFNRIVDHVKVDGYSRFVISDFRFPNEYNVFQRRSSEIDAEIIPVRIDRPDRSVSFVGTNDISETALDKFSDWKFVVPNTGTIGDLYNIAKSSLFFE